MALFGSFICCAARSANLDGKLFTVGVTNKLTRLLLDVASGASTFVHSFALLGAIPVTNFLDGLVAFLDGLIESLLLEGDLTGLLKVLLADLLLCRIELCDVGVVALFQVLVRTLKDWIFLKRGHLFILFDATKPGLGIWLAPGKVNATLLSNVIDLFSLSHLTPVNKLAFQAKQTSLAL